jgi:hypothetical protein
MEELRKTGKRERNHLSMNIKKSMKDDDCSSQRLSHSESHRTSARPMVRILS